jgi:hypothetical protein
MGGRNVRSACGHAEARPGNAEARRERQFAPGAGAGRGAGAGE